MPHIILKNTPAPATDQKLIHLCPSCGLKLRPFGAELLSGQDGGLYYRSCESCGKHYGFQKDTNEMKFDGALQALHFFQKTRKNSGHH